MHAHLRQTLEQMHRELHLEVEQATFTDERDEALVRELLDDIHRVLESADEGEGEHELPLNERLNHAIERFEDSHPSLTATMSRFAQALGRIAV